MSVRELSSCISISDVFLFAAFLLFSNNVAFILMYNKVSFFFMVSSCVSSTGAGQKRLHRNVI